MEKNALAFNWDRCCHLVLCLRLIPLQLFHPKWKSKPLVKAKDFDCPRVTALVAFFLKQRVEASHFAVMLKSRVTR